MQFFGACCARHCSSAEGIGAATDLDIHTTDMGMLKWDPDVLQALEVFSQQILSSDPAVAGLEQVCPHCYMAQTPFLISDLI